MHWLHSWRAERQDQRVRSWSWRITEKVSDKRKGLKIKIEEVWQRKKYLAKWEMHGTLLSACKQYLEKEMHDEWE